MSKNKESQLIWESYITRREGIEDDFAEFADENPSKKPQPTKSSSLKLNRPPQKELDEYGRDYIYKGPKDGAFAREEHMTQALSNLPAGLRQMFTPSKEGSFYVIVPSEVFKSYGSDGEGMGGTAEHDMGDMIVGLADGHYLEYIKHAAPEQEDPDADQDRQSLNDYRRSEGL